MAREMISSLWSTAPVEITWEGCSSGQNKVVLFTFAFPRGVPTSLTQSGEDSAFSFLSLHIHDFSQHQGHIKSEFSLLLSLELFNAWPMCNSLQR